MADTQLPGDALLTVRRLSTDLKTLIGTVRAVDAISLDIRRGEAVAIVGESGCGKSMTARSILRILPKTTDKTSADSVIFESRDLMSLSEREMRAVRGARISMIFQDPMSHLDPSMKIGTQIAEVARVHLALGGPALAKAVRDAMAAAQLPEIDRIMASYPHQLSGGLRQRALIAMALVCDPVLLIADEPTTALDVTTQKQILALLRQLVVERNMGLILITHDLGVVANMCDRVYVMYAGQIVERASVADFFARPQHPYSRGLLHSVRSIGRTGERLASIPGTVPSLLSPPAGCRFRNRCGEPLAICSARDPASIPTDSSSSAACWRLYPELVPNV
jgi:oligopeptide/dipeptide ABC transporter ATP-binding protein